MNRINNSPSVQSVATDPPAFRLRLQETSGAFEFPELAFNQPRVALGSVLDSDVRFANRLGLVSRRHASIHARDGLFWIIDCGSKQGVRLNGHRLQPWLRYRLRAGDCISVGEYRIDFALE